jgi:putative integral membrane protein (TIGR02587 family)
MGKIIDIKLQEISGAFLFGIPMLYTMEMWWIGQYAEDWKLLIFLLAAYIVGVLLYSFRLSGAKQRWRLSMERATGALAVGIVSAFVVLMVLNQIRWNTSLDAIAGMVVIQSVPLSIGASAARSLLAVDESKTREGAEDEQEQQGVWKATFNDVGATLAGSIFIALPLAPTEEIPMLAAEMQYGHVVMLVLLTLFVTYTLVFESGFNPHQRQPAERKGIFQRPVTETVMAYLIALVVAMFSLYLFDRIGAADPLYSILTNVAVLGLPAAVGGAAGRLVL